MSTNAHRVELLSEPARILVRVSQVEQPVRLRQADPFQRFFSEPHGELAVAVLAAAAAVWAEAAGRADSLLTWAI